ncbi:MAG: tetraacyldisaccharide 4'-kinase [Alphaproteobacteria bacterium]|nr:tetraacyldisaccharide 4'-kinase [Alphaproteobacteria bacterium]
MKTPTHWKNVNLLSLLLYPFGCLYGLATSLRILLNTPKKVDAKVICVGNLTAGGTGKTPISVSLAKMLQQNGQKPIFVSRGYGGRLKDIMVNPQQHTAVDVGDEPLLLARQAPVVINPNRYLGALLAQQEGANYIILDDGFQNPSLYKNKSIIVIDGNVGLGNEFCIPAGPLREFISSGLKRAHAVAIIGEDKYNISQKIKNIPIFKGQIKAISPSPLTYDVVAFAGIGRPEKFYNSLAQYGFNIVVSKDFPDHHYYTEQELEELITIGKKHKAPVYTTAKDFVKIPPHLQSKFKVLEIEIEWENPSELLNFLINS